MKLDSNTSHRIAELNRGYTPEQLAYLRDDPMAASDWAIFDAEFLRFQAELQLETEQAMRRIRDRKSSARAGYEFLYG